MTRTSVLMLNQPGKSHLEQQVVRPDVAVVIPALNEEGAIGMVLDAVQTALSEQNYKSEIVVVDGGSTDRTVEIAKDHGAKVLTQTGEGYGDALAIGFEYSARTYHPPVLIMMDADGTYEAKALPGFINPILAGEADVVLGNRFADIREGGMGLTNRVGNRLISWLCRRLLGIGVSDTQSGMRSLRTDLLWALKRQADGMAYATEMLYEAGKAGARILEVPIAYNRRIGKSKLNPLTDGAKIFGTILRLSRDYRPIGTSLQGKLLVLADLIKRT